MLPVIISVGTLKFSPFVIFALTAIFFGLYWWWKLGRDEHLEETVLFDVYFISLLVFLIVSRAIFVGMHLADFENVYRILGVTSFPGMSYLGGFVGATLSVVIVSYLREWEVWKVLDNWATSLGVVCVIASIGWLLGSSLEMAGLAGLQILWSIVFFVVVNRVRKNFRFYAWYKNDRSVAPEGLPALVALIFGGLLYVVRGLFLDVWYIIGGVVVVLTSALIIYIRSGRAILRKK